MIVRNEGGIIVGVTIIGAIALGVSLQNHKVSTRDLFDDIGKRYEVEPPLLRAIQLVENPKGLRIATLNENGTRDYGLMQINEKTLKHYKIPESVWLEDAASIDTAGRYMGDTRKELGSIFNIFNWIAAYNIGVPAVKTHGIQGGSYTGAVYYHYLMFKFANA